MTNTITKLSEQCSPLQCFEDAGAGQSVPDAQNGADTYAECGCAGLFSLAGVPLLFGIFDPMDPKEAGLKFGRARDPIVRQGLSEIERVGGSKGQYSLAAERVENEVEVPLLLRLPLGKPMPIRDKLALDHDRVVVSKKKAEFYYLAGKYSAAADAFMNAAQSVATYAQEEDNGILGELFEEGRPGAVCESNETGLPTLEVEAYVDLTNQAVRSLRQNVFEGAGGSSKDVAVAINLLKGSSGHLKGWGYVKQADEMAKQGAKMGPELQVLKWLEGTKNWVGHSARLKRLRFVFIRDALEEEMKDKKYTDNERYRPDMQKVITSVVKRAVIDGIKRSGKDGIYEVARFYLMVGHYEEALRYLNAYLKQPGVMMEPCDEMIDIARVAGSRVYEAMAWEHKAKAYGRQSVQQIDAAILAIETAQVIYGEIGELEARKRAVKTGLALIDRKNDLLERKQAIRSKGRPRAIGVEGEGQLGAIGAKKKGEEGGGHEKKERKGKERPGK